MKTLLKGTLAAVGFASTVYAGNCNNLVCDQVKINEIMATAWGTITVDTNADETKLSCKPFANKYVYVPADAAGKNAIYSALLTAKTTGKPIRFNLKKDNKGFCQIQYVNIKN